MLEYRISISSWALKGLRWRFFCLAGSLDSEAGIYAMGYDVTGTRLVTCEADKTIKMWKEDENATPQSHPGIPFKIPKDMKRF